MSEFFTVYNIGTGFPGVERLTNTFEIYDSEETFLNELKLYLNYSEECMLEINNKYYEDDPAAKEEYEDYVDLIEERLINPETSNALYKTIFELFNIEVRILVATNDYNIFFNQLYEDLKETYIDYDYSELEEEEIDEIIEDEPVLELFFYLEKVKSSNEIHNKQHLINKFKEYESTINLDTFSFRF